MTEDSLYDTCYVGDCRQSLTILATAGVKVQTCVTSPPYFGLRDYGVDGQIGLEQTPDEYVAQMVEVFRGVRDVLADDGTLWLNLGDSYWNHSPVRTSSAGAFEKTFTGGKISKGERRRANGHETLKMKDLIGIPWRVAFALQSDGWYLRSDIIWSKSNPMPESVTDRPTKAHEYLFLLAKSERYYYDADAVREPYADARRGASHTKSLRYSEESGRNGDSGLGKPPPHAGKNKRTVWTVTPKPYKGAHFATFPPDLISPCILAGSRVGDAVLDPFMGSGTTAEVAKRHGRRWVGCELNPEYVSLQLQRLQGL